MRRRSFKSGKSLLATASVALPAIAVTSLLRAEEGLNFTLGVSQQVEQVDREGFTDNSDEGLRSVTSLDFGLTSETSNQSLTVRLGTGLAYEFSNRSGFETEDPSLQFNYIIENRSSRLSFNGSYTRSDLDDTIFFDDLAEEFIISDTGTRENYSLRSGLMLGRDGPVTFDLSHAYSNSTYNGTTDPSLGDTVTQGVNARLSFRLSPVATVNVFANRRKIDQSGATASDRTTQSAGIGGSYEVSPVTRVSGQISYDETETAGVGGTIRNDGLGYSLNLSHDRPTGIYGLDFSGGQTVNGTRNQVELSRNFDLGQRGSGSLSLGGTKTGGFDVQPLVNATLNYTLDARSQISGTLSQSSAVSNNNNETVRTRLGVNYRRELNSISSISAGLQLADQNILSDTGLDQQSIRADLTYRRAVGEDWDLVSGYRYSTIRQDTQADRNTSTLFAGIQKTFAFRP